MIHIREMYVSMPKHFQIIGIVFVILLLFFILVAVVLSHTSETNYFVGSILPELIGFTLEGIVFVVLFSSYNYFRETREDKKRKETIKITMFHSISSFSTMILEVVNPERTISHTQPSGRKVSYDLICSSLKKTDDEYEKVKNLVNIYLPSFTSYISISSNIDQAHAVSWHYFVLYLNHFFTEKNKDDAYVSFVKAINQLTEWDESDIEIIKNEPNE